jgi:hypothetical protein
MWGDNQFGQLGDDSTANKNYPVEIAGNDERWMWLDVGYAHAGAVKNDGSAWIWGLNDAGQLGSQNRINQSSPIQALLAGKTWMSLYCGRRFSGAIELPASPTPQYTPYATQTPASTLVPTSTPVSTNPTPSPTLSLSPTPGATQPTATPVATATPLPTETEATVTPTPSASISPTPTSTEATVTPTPSVTLSPTPSGTEATATPTSTPTSTPTPTPTFVGYLFTWGQNGYGQLGSNSLNPNNYPLPISTVSNVLAVDTGNQIAGMIQTGGNLYMWGSNAYGGLPDEIANNLSSPVQVGNDKFWIDISLGNNFGAGLSNN